MRFNLIIKYYFGRMLTKHYALMNIGDKMHNQDNS